MQCPSGAQWYIVREMMRRETHGAGAVRQPHVNFGMTVGAIGGERNARAVGTPRGPLVVGRDCS